MLVMFSHPVGAVRGAGVGWEFLPILFAPPGPGVWCPCAKKFPFAAEMIGLSMVPLAQSSASVPPVAETVSPMWVPPHSLGAIGPATSVAQGPAAVTISAAISEKKIPFGVAKWDLETDMDPSYQR